MCKLVVLALVIVLELICFSSRTISHAVARNTLHEILEYLDAEERTLHGGIISVDQTQILLDTIWVNPGCSKALDPVLCRGCLQAADLFNIVNANVSFGLQERDFERASVVLIYYLENGVCNLSEETGTNLTYVDYLFDVLTTQARSEIVLNGPNQRPIINNLSSNLSFSEVQLRSILELINVGYKPKTVNKCFTSKGVFEDVGLKSDEKANESDVEKLSSVVIAHLVRGDCIGESQTIHPKIFAESIFQNYGTFGVILEHDFDQLLSDLDIGGQRIDKDDGSHAWRKYSSKEPLRKKRAVQKTREHSHGETTEKANVCYTYKELLGIYEVEDGISSVSSFHDICPALIEQIASGACEGVGHKHIVHYQSAIEYAWATLAVFIVSLCSMIAIIIVPLASVKVYTGVMHLLVALAVSTLSGDALLHLIPEALGLHIHEDHQHKEVQTPEQVLLKVMVVVAAVYAFFLFERLMIVCLGSNHRGKKHKTIDKLGEVSGEHTEYSPAMYQAGNTYEMHEIGDDLPQFSDIDNIEKYSRPSSPARKLIEEPLVDQNGEHSVDTAMQNPPISTSTQYQNHELTDTLFVERTQKELSARTSFSFTKGMQSICVMVLIGDAVHNMTDGVAIGVAFTLDGYVGISTCLAVFFHELPHEIGDFAVLLKNGLTFKTAFFWSLMSNLGGFVGVYIGIALGSQESIHQWIFAATAGMFLYIALVDLMPEITHDPAGFSGRVFLMHNIGLVVGWTIMILLAYFESLTNGTVNALEKPIPV